MMVKEFCIVNHTDEKALDLPANGPPKILVADDDEALRESIVDLLQMEGLEVIQAINGRDALNKVISERPCVLILDNRMPELTGSEAFKELRRLGIKIPVILVTAAAEISSLAEKLGIECYIGKPFGIDELIETVNNALQGKCS